MGAVEEVAAHAGSINYQEIVAAWSPEERAEREKKLLRKIDWRLLPILVCSSHEVPQKSSALLCSRSVRSAYRSNITDSPIDQIVMYLNNYVDRNALPYARVQGIEEDLGLTGMVSPSTYCLLPTWCPLASTTSFPHSRLFLHSVDSIPI